MAEEQEDFLIKEQTYNSFKTTNHINCEQRINNANVIILYGVSLGSTDQRWWKIIGENLVRRKNLALIHFIYAPNTITPTRKHKIAKLEREQQYNINGIFVAAIGIHESAWGTSKIAQNKNNLFGYGAYDSSPYSSSYNFDTYAEGIDLIARVLVKYYLNPSGTAIYNGEVASGKYYNGNTLTGVNTKYATDKNWANGVYKHMEYLYKKI